MSNGAQPDYAALAKQAGAINSLPPGGVDYAALAKQAGAISSQAPGPKPGYGAANLGSPEDISTGPEGTTPDARLMSPASQADATRKGLGIAGGIASLATGGIGGTLAQMGIQGGIGAATGAGSAATDENAKAEDIINGALVGGASGVGGALLGGAPGAIAKTKFGRSLINESVGATGRDVIYGNPAKALLDEGIITPTTGDIEAVKAGKGLIDAGGRLGAVSQRLMQLQPQVNSALAASTKTIPIADAVDKPLMDAFNEITANRAMTAAEKQAAISQLGDLQQSLHAGLGSDITPLQANQLKNQIGARVRWTGTNQVGDEVKPAYKAVYASLKDAVNNAVPEVADLNERLTNLHAAQDDLLTLSRNEEVGRGRGVLRGTIGTTAFGALESGAGRVLPGAAAAGRFIPPAAIGSIPALGSQLNPDVKVAPQGTAPAVPTAPAQTPDSSAAEKTGAQLLDKHGAVQMRQALSNPVTQDILQAVAPNTAAFLIKRAGVPDKTSFGNRGRGV